MGHRELKEGHRRLKEEVSVELALCDGEKQAEERVFEITLTGRLDCCSEADLAEAKAMLNGIAHEVKRKFNRGAFTSHSNNCAVVDEAETEIY